MNTQASETQKSRPLVSTIPDTDADDWRTVIDDEALWRLVGAMSESEMMQTALTLADLQEGNETFRRECYLELRFGNRQALDAISKSNLKVFPTTTNLARAITNFQMKLAAVLERISNASPQDIQSVETSLFADGQRMLMRPEFAIVTESEPGKTPKSPRHVRTGIQIRRHHHLFADDDALLGYLSVLFCGRQLLGEQKLSRCRNCRHFFFLGHKTGGRPRSRFCSVSCAKSGKGLDAAERSRRYRLRKRDESKAKTRNRAPRRAK